MNRLEKNRRAFLRAAAGAVAAMALPSHALRLDAGASVFNPCGNLSDELRNHPLTTAAFEGLNPSDVWDCHAHLLGLGESGGGAWVTPKMQSLLRLRLYAQYRFYLNASCVNPANKIVDRDFLARLMTLMADFPQGYRAMVMAFDRTHDANGKPDLEKSAFYLPDKYAADVAAQNQARLLWTASIHPYRSDAVSALDEAVRNGAVAVKWLPPAMGIDPASPRCDAFYEAMARHRLPLITHGGEEKAVEGAHQPAFGNVLKLRRPLEHGVLVVVAHCASLGWDVDLDKGPKGPKVSCFELFERLMATSQFEGRLFGDISALPQTNRMAYLERILKHRDWQGRLLNGSDYPLPGVLPLFSVDAFVERNWLSSEVGEHLKQIRGGNPLLFDFLLKRHLEIDGQKFGRDVFETARIFRRTT
ncbi:MAG: amidohydrolase [Betaproteobacteria bacterium]|nr:amidohydrolase [Betaproteobacteria bacterium]